LSSLLSTVWSACWSVLNNSWSVCCFSSILHELYEAHAGVLNITFYVCCFAKLYSTYMKCMLFCHHYYQLYEAHAGLF
jgi:hypothetical protein